MIVLDTGGLYALLDSSDAYHDAAHRSLDGHDCPLLLSPLILAEADYLVATRLGSQAERDFLGEVTDKVYRLASFGDADMESAVDLVNTYADMEIGIADASVAVLAARYRMHHLGGLRPGKAPVRRPDWHMRRRPPRKRGRLPPQHSRSDA